MTRSSPRHSPRIVSSRPCAWVLPRAHRDASQRFHTHGPIQPMDYDRPGWIARLLGRAR
jgi:hypothetical protein